MERINGLTRREYADFYRDLWFAACERSEIDAVHSKWFSASAATSYPDEYYSDKDNMMRGEPTGHLRCLVSRGGKMVWVKHGREG